MYYSPELCGDIPVKKVCNPNSIVLQPLSVMYLADIFAGFTKKVAEYMYTQPGTIEETFRNITDCVTKNDGTQCYYFTILSKESLCCIGCAGIRVVEDTVALPRFWLREDVWFQGCGQKALSLLLSFIKNNIRCDYVFVSVDKRNIGAKIILERAKGEIQRQCFSKENAHGVTNIMVSYKIHHL